MLKQDKVILIIIIIFTILLCICGYLSTKYNPQPCPIEIKEEVIKSPTPNINPEPQPKPPCPCPEPCPKPKEPLPPVCGPVKLTVFFAPWCGACQRVEPEINRLEKQGVIITRFNADNNPELIKIYGIKLLPTFILCTKDGCFKTNNIKEITEKLAT